MSSFILYTSIVVILAFSIFYIVVFGNSKHSKVYHVLVVPAATNFKPMIDERPLVVLNQSDFSYSHNQRDDIYVFRMVDKSLKTEQEYETIVTNLLGNREYKIYL